MIPLGASCGCPFCDCETFADNHREKLFDVLRHPRMIGELIGGLMLTGLMEQTNAAPKEHVKKDIQLVMRNKHELLTDSKASPSLSLQNYLENHRTSVIEMLCTDDKRLRALAVITLLKGDPDNFSNVERDVDRFYAFQNATA